MTFRELPASWATILGAVQEAWPEHAPFLQRLVEGADPVTRETAERTSARILRLASADGELARLIRGYRWMCDMVLEEELHFRRTGAYRYSKFEDALREVYSHAERMDKYMSGLLLSQALWPNHLATFDFYLRELVPLVKPGVGRHLEIGPGHGLLLSEVAARGPAEIRAWDVSETSLHHTKECLARLGVTAPVALETRNIFDPPRPADEHRYDTIVFSEVLEHLEQPRQALEGLRRLAAPGARLFVNAPVNSPALDHLYLFRAPEEVVDLVAGCGFRVDSVRVAPAAGMPEARARKLRFAISTALVASAV